MTTIAATKTQIACDRQATHGSGMIFTVGSKITHIPAGNKFFEAGGYVGYAGALGECTEAIFWLLDPEGKPPRTRKSDFLVLTNDKKLFLGESITTWYEIGDQYFSIGSGMTFAQAAMASGKTALEAVKLASKFDPNTGRGFKSYDV